MGLGQVGGRVVVEEEIERIRRQEVRRSGQPWDGLVFWLCGGVESPMAVGGLAPHFVNGGGRGGRHL